MLELQGHFPRLWIVTPKVEIIRDMLNKLGVCTADMSEARLLAAGWAERLCTPVRLRNALLAGQMDPPTALCFDELHHHTAETNQQIDWLCGTAPAVGFTATYFRGTPAGTAALRNAWGDPYTMISYPAAVAAGIISMPSCVILPLVDDDSITVTGGEFQVTTAGDAVISRLSAIVDWAASQTSNRRFDRPTMFATPNTESCLQLTEALVAAGVNARSVTQASTQSQRYTAFYECLGRESALVQINVVSEGVDLAIRRLVDLSPDMSPVRWLQKFGRATRPGGESVYVCTNRNLIRHAYLLEGCLPPSTVAEATKAFGGPGSRYAQRVLGLEALGRLRASDLPLADGTLGLCYQMSSVEGITVTEYTCLVHPAKAAPLWAKRTRYRATEGTEARYGRWARCNAPEGLEGFASIPASPPSPKQQAWWDKAAKRHGLDPTAKVTRKNFAALPVLSDLRTKL